MLSRISSEGFCGEGTGPINPSADPSALPATSPARGAAPRSSRRFAAFGASFSFSAICSERTQGDLSSLAAHSGSLWKMIPHSPFLSIASNSESARIFSRWIFSARARGESFFSASGRPSIEISGSADSVFFSGSACFTGSAFPKQSGGSGLAADSPAFSQYARASRDTAATSSGHFFSRRSTTFSSAPTVSPKIACCSSTILASSPC